MIIESTINVDTHKCPACGEEMELHAFDRIQSVRYVGMEAIWLCDSFSCRYKRLEIIENARLRRDQERPEAVMRLNGFPELFLKCSFDNLRGNDAAVNACRKHYRKESMHIYGLAGLGKTHLLGGMGRELVNQGYYDFLFISASKLFDLIARAAFKRDEREGTEYEIIDRYSQTGILFLDDLGQHGASEFIISKLYLVIDQRYSNELPTIVTSNFDLMELQHKLGEPVASRLAAGRIINITGSDYRKQQNIQSASNQNSGG